MNSPDTTPEALALGEYIPDRERVRQLLVQYFDGEITDDVVDALYERYMASRADHADESSLRRIFEVRSNKQGFAWWEDFVGDRALMTPSDVVLLLAHVRATGVPGDLSLPQPKLYCPKWFVGTWEQLEPTPQTGRRCFWRMAPDGKFQADSIGVYYDAHANLLATDVVGKKHWRVARTPGGRYVKLTLLDEHYRGPWSLVQIDPEGDEIVGNHLGDFRYPRFRLVRTPQADGVYR